MITKIYRLPLIFILTLSLKSFGQTPAPLTIKNQLIVDSEGNGSGLQFTGMNASSNTTIVPAKVLTLDGQGKVIMGMMPTIPVIPIGATVWDLTNGVVSTAATNVVIGSGVTIPAGSNYNLYVSKGILTEKMRVAVAGTSFWADYVFDKSYHLPSLRSVEKFVLENKHLPNVPSAGEVVKNGIDFTEMQATLLRKIEELTLYTIRQEKELTKLKKRVSILNRK